MTFQEAIAIYEAYRLHTTREIRLAIETLRDFSGQYGSYEQEIEEMDDWLEGQAGWEQQQTVEHEQFVREQARDFILDNLSSAQTYTLEFMVALLRTDRSMAALELQIKQHLGEVR